MNIELFSQQTPKQFFGGTHRTRAPEATLAEYGALMPKMGITRLANITGLDRIGLPVCIAVRPNSRTLATSQGKGETLALAKASAMMESIEGWHAERVQGPLLYDSWLALAQQLPMVDVHELAIRADATFCADRPINWIEGLDLMRGHNTWVPFETVSVNLVKQPGHKPIFLESTNGLSSGNSTVEAVIHALCEVIERDAVTLWGQLPRDHKKARQVDLSTISDPGLRRVIDQLAAKGVVLGVWDITSDIGLPTFTCTLVEDPDSEFWRPVTTSDGHGTHLVPEIALSRAINEAIQARLTFISGSRDDIFPADYIKHGNRDDHIAIAGAIREPAAPLAFDPPRLPVSGFFEDDLQTILQQLRKIGINSAVVVDLSRKEIGIPVVKVIVPGLEPFHTPMYQPGKRAQRLRPEFRA